MRILAIEPFYGGSHRQFLDQWAKRSGHDFDLVTLSARKWKWRMRQAAITVAVEVEKRFALGARWDLLFASDMLNLAELRGLAPGILGSMPAVLYFHENQITYPVRQEKERDVHFGLTNLISALAADQIWFNSEYHRRELFGALRPFLRRMPDHRSLDRIAELREKSRVEPPGVEDPLLSVLRKPRPTQEPLRILWVARWEHDKDPETFFRALARLARAADFRLSVLGQSYREIPDIFESAKALFAERIDHWGHLPRRSDYHRALCRADVVVSTARHEFFGLAVVEAILAGAHPVLPNRLSYPELLGPGASPAGLLYDGGAGVLASRLSELIQAKRQGQLEPGLSRPRVEKYLWSQRQPALDDALDLVAKNRSPA